MRSKILKRKQLAPEFMARVREAEQNQSPTRVIETRLLEKPTFGGRQMPWRPHSPDWATIMSRLCQHIVHKSCMVGDTDAPADDLAGTSIANATKKAGHQSLTPPSQVMRPLCGVCFACGNSRFSRYSAFICLGGMPAPAAVNLNLPDSVFQRLSTQPILAEMGMTGCQSRPCWPPSPGKLRTARSRTS